MNQPTYFDIVIIGGGPAGISAAIWSCDLGLSTAVIEEKSELGGQLLHVHNPITNYPGRTAGNGLELRDHLVKSFEGFAATTLLNRSVENADFVNKRIQLDGGEQLECSAIILATGVKRRRLDVPGEAEFSGRGIMESGVKEKNGCAGKSVLIVGGGDAALENASILGDIASRVYLVHRRAEFSSRNEFTEAAKANPKVAFRLGWRVKRFSGDRSLDGVDIENISSGETEHLEIDAALVRIGVEPNAGLFPEKEGIDREGFIQVDRFCQTCIEGVYAVGDVANPISPTIVTAAGMGATAAKSAYNLICGKQRL